MSKKDAGAKRYEVGFGKPPKHTRFKPGVSGNPSGKRKDARNLSTDVRQALLAPVKLKQEGRSRRVSTQRALLMRLREKALNGDSRSLDRLIDLAGRYNNEPQGQAALSSQDDQEILAAYQRDILERHNRSSD